MESGGEISDGCGSHGSEGWVRAEEDGGVSRVKKAGKGRGGVDEADGDKIMRGTLSVPHLCHQEIDRKCDHAWQPPCPEVAVRCECRHVSISGIGVLWRLVHVNQWSGCEGMHVV